MSKTIGERIVLSTIICLVGLGIVILHAQIGATTAGKASQEVRMSVDPTVLPLVPPPGAPSEAVEKTEPMGETDDGVPMAEGKPVIAPEVVQEKAEAPETKAAPVVQPKPAPKPTTTAQSASKTVGKGVVTGLALQSTDKAFTLTVTCDRPVGDTSYMNLNGPTRLVIDMRQPWLLKAKNVLRSSTGPVKHVVVGAHPDRLRFVVHFRTPPNGKLTPEFVRKGNQLTIAVPLP